MNFFNSCSGNRVTKWIRITLSLLVIVLGILHKNVFGFLGILTLINALSGTCPLHLTFNSKKYSTGGDCDRIF